MSIVKYRKNSSPFPILITSGFNLRYRKIPIIFKITIEERNENKTMLRVCFIPNKLKKENNNGWILGRDEKIISTRKNNWNIIKIPNCDRFLGLARLLITTINKYTSIVRIDMEIITKIIIMSNIIAFFNNI